MGFNFYRGFLPRSRNHVSLEQGKTIWTDIKNISFIYLRKSLPYLRLTFLTFHRLSSLRLSYIVECSRTWFRSKKAFKSSLFPADGTSSLLHTETAQRVRGVLRADALGLHPVSRVGARFSRHCWRAQTEAEARFRFAEGTKLTTITIIFL